VILFKKNSIFWPEINNYQCLLNISSPAHDISSDKTSILKKNFFEHIYIVKANMNESEHMYFANNSKRCFTSDKNKKIVNNYCV
jgi:hypothetical protein